jgi:hypothetical protein
VSPSDPGLLFLDIAVKASIISSNDTDSILDIEYDFYKDLYSSVQIENDKIDEFLEHVNKKMPLYVLKFYNPLVIKILVYNF